ncbi:hypothetical protein BU16DRAFT_212410 [Lophium mytilinum]|uniref:Uncharacterized protein n=1 Tax=Lophium mytilinum TaxID=390894 RepID=A0A6A6RAU5_9PEZI|nr:hypothetical protein BU16DRAFT_212410 [Lophium mytilinum]
MRSTGTTQDLQPVEIRHCRWSLSEVQTFIVQLLKPPPQGKRRLQFWSQANHDRASRPVPGRICRSQHQRCQPRKHQENTKTPPRLRQQAGRLRKPIARATPSRTAHTKEQSIIYPSRMEPRATLRFVPTRASRPI